MQPVIFLHGIDPPNLGVTSVPAMNDRVSQAINTLVVLDEYKNDLDLRKIAYLKGLWGGGGQTKKNTNTDGMAAQTIVTTGVALCGQDKPTQDMALYTRVIFLAFTKTSFNQLEKRHYEDLVSLCNLGLTHLTIEVLSHRELFEKNFPEIYSITKRELATKLDQDDKIVESPYYSLERYFEKLGTKNKNLFVATDDYTVIEDIKKKYPDWNVWTLCSPLERGYVQSVADKESFQEKDRNMILLFATMEILNRSERFVGTYNSNIGMFQGMRNPSICSGVDFDHWVVW